MITENVLFNYELNVLLSTEMTGEHSRFSASNARETRIKSGRLQQHKQITMSVISLVTIPRPSISHTVLVHK